MTTTERTTSGRTMSGERLVRLDGTHNLRDVGGRPAGPSTTRWGRLYRSDALHQLSAQDVAELDRRGIRTVIDLRDPLERDFAPNAFHDLAVDQHHVPVFGVPPVSFIARDAHLSELYDHVVDERGDQVVAVLRVLARAASDQPVVVHCTAGKDRTGVVVALALEAVGVDREAVVADYAETEDHLSVELLDEIVERLRAQHDHAAVNLEELVRRSPAAILERTLERIDARHGSVVAYLAAHGLADDDLSALRHALVA